VQPALQPRLVERRVLAFGFELGAVEHPGSVRIEHHDVGGAAGRKAPPGRLSSSAGRVDIALSRAGSAMSPLCARRRLAASMVSMPIAPDAASAKGRRLVSTSWGSWSDITASIRPDASA